MVTGGYVAAAAAWVLVSGQLGVWLAHSTEQLERIEVLKGWGFVAVTGALLFALLRRRERVLNQWAKEALTSRTQFRSLVEVSPVAIVIQRDERLVFANAAAARLFRAESPTALLGRAVFELLDPSDHSGVKERTARALAGLTFAPFVRRGLVALDGTKLVAEVGAVAIEWEGASAVQLTLQDISEREARQAEARARADELDAIFEAISESIMLVSAQGIVVRANSTGRDTFGLDPVGLPVSALLARLYDVPPERTFIDRIRAGERIDDVELEVPRAGGRTFAFSARAVKDVHGLTGLVVAAHDVTQQARHARALRSLAASLQTVREEVETRIARDLHDDLGQVLTALRFSLERVERKLGEDVARNTVLDSVVETSELVSQALTSLRRIASGLRPATLDALGLAAALRTELDAFGARTGLSMQVAIIEPPALPPATSTALFRIAQEALTNVARHAGARTVSVSLHEVDTRLVLTVTDDGAGFDVAAAENSLGLLGMHERAAAVGGTLVLTSAAGKGTTVRATVPGAVTPTRKEGPP